MNAGAAKTAAQIYLDKKCANQPISRRVFISS
jgi:hypothetical protein